MLCGCSYLLPSTGLGDNVVDAPQETDKEDVNEDGAGSEEEQQSSTPSKGAKIKNALLMLFRVIASETHETIQDFKDNFKPKVGFSIAAMIGIVFLIGLGTWQMQRLSWKTALQTAIDTKMKHDPLNLTTAPENTDWERFLYQPVIATGDLMIFKSIKIQPRTHDGQVGFHLLTPIRLDNGALILANRGWAPDGHKIVNPYWDSESVSLQGIMHAPNEKGFFTPENNPRTDEWYWVDIEAIGKDMGLPALENIILYVDDGYNLRGEEDYPIGGQIVLELRNWHLMYAITWYTLAGFLFLIWVAYSWGGEAPAQPQKSEDAEEEEGSDEDTEESEPSDKPEVPPAEQ